MNKSDERHKEKLAIRADSRRKHEARQAARVERDSKLRSEYERYKKNVQRIWTDWRSEESEEK